MRRVVTSPEAATMRFGDGAADAKSHAGSMNLGSKERVEDLVRLLQGQPQAGVTDRHRQLVILSSFRYDVEPARAVNILHRIDPIDHQIHEHLLQCTRS